MIDATEGHWENGKVFKEIFFVNSDFGLWYLKPYVYLLHIPERSGGLKEKINQAFQAGIKRTNLKKKIKK